MPLLHQLEKETELCQCFEETRIFPALLNVHFYLKTLIEKRFPPVENAVFAAPFPKTEYWLIVRRHRYIKPFIHLATIHDEKTISKEDYMDVLEQFRPYVSDLLDKTFIILSASATLAELFTQVFNLANVVTHHDPTFFYYMDEQIQSAVKQLTITLPDGYTFLENNPHHFADIITNTWSYSGPGELEQTTAKLRYMPSVIVMNGDHPVAFEMLEPSGYLNHQFTFPEHRRKGLGTAVELKMAQKCIQEGIWPYKQVTPLKEDAIKLSNASPYWKLRRDSEGEPVRFVFKKFN